MNLALLAVIACGINQAALAGESTSTTEMNSSGGQATTNKFKATSGPGGAKVSHTKTNVQGNADGSVTASKQHESHSVGAAGAAHHRSASSTTVSPNGSASTAKTESRSTTP
jgi:hypothetical protein